MTSSNKSDPFPFVAESGVPYTPTTERDPFEIMDDLMTVIEALSPKWPDRETIKEGKYWLI
jgi:hypothetical protein